MYLNTITLRKYPDDALFNNVRATYRYRGDRLVWTRNYAPRTKSEILRDRADLERNTRKGLRWEGDPVSSEPTFRLDFLSDNLLGASPLWDLPVVAAAVNGPSSKVMRLSLDQLAQMLAVCKALETDTLTDGIAHFKHMGGFALELIVPGEA